MIEVTSPEQFRQVPWKNGKGVTQELAINDGGTLVDFEWRLSIASVTENVVFSDFSNYWRQLTLISGNGIELKHGEHQTDRLESLLDIASFDGQWLTQGLLLDGAIEDLNVMTRKGAYRAKVSNFREQTQIQLEDCELAFIYSLGDCNLLNQQSNSNHSLKAGCLMRIEKEIMADWVFEANQSMLIQIFRND